MTTRPTAAPPSKPTPLFVALFTMLVVVTLRSPAVDFITIHQSATAGVYRQNLSLPHTTAVLIWPLLALPMPAAKLLWQVLDLTCAWFCLRAFARTPWQTVYVVFAALTWWSLVAGNLAFLTVLTVLLAYTARSDTRAGLWFGIAVALKPFLALPLLTVGWSRPRLALTGAATAAAIFGAGLVILGWQEYAAWWHAASTAPWGVLPINLSLSRWLPTWALALVAMSVVLAVAAGNADGWRAGMPAALLCSPLGWQYYGWCLMPAWPPRGWRWIPWVALSIPGIALPSLPIGTAALIVLLLDGLWNPRGTIGTGEPERALAAARHQHVAMS